MSAEHLEISRSGTLKTILVLGLSTFLTLFDVTSVVVAVASIRDTLQLEPRSSAWIIDAYSVPFTAALLAAGAFADRFGRHRSMLVGNAVFLLASLTCALASNGPIFFLGRAVQGLGASFMITGAISLVASAFPNAAQRARAFGAIGIIGGVAMALGPTIGGALAAWAGWWWIFIVNVPICILLGVMVPWCVEESRNPDAHKLDALGICLFTTALVLAVYGLLHPSAAWSFRLMFFLASAFAAAAFIVQQARADHPTIDPHVFGSRTMAAVAYLIVALQFGYWAVLVYLPQFLVANGGLDLGGAGIAMLLATLPMLAIPPIGSRIVARLGWRPLFAWAFGLVTAGNAALGAAALFRDAPASIFAGGLGMGLIGIGAALANPQLSGVVIMLAPSHRAGMASAITMILRQAGFAVSVAIMGAIIANPELPGSSLPLFAVALCFSALAAGLALVALPKKGSQ